MEGNDHQMERNAGTPSTIINGNAAGEYLGQAISLSLMHISDPMTTKMNSNSPFKLRNGSILDHNVSHGLLTTTVWRYLSPLTTASEKTVATDGTAVR